MVCCVLFVCCGHGEIVCALVQCCSVFAMRVMFWEVVPKSAIFGKKSTSEITKSSSEINSWDDATKRNQFSGRRNDNSWTMCLNAGYK